MRHLLLAAVESSALGTCDECHRTWLPLARRLVPLARPFGAEVPATALAAHPSERHVHVEHVGFQAGTLGKDDASQSFVKRKQTGHVLTCTLLPQVPQ
jgi:hypothetical protein